MILFENFVTIAFLNLSEMNPNEAMSHQYFETSEFQYKNNLGAIYCNSLSGISQWVIPMYAKLIKQKLYFCFTSNQLII